MTRDHILFQLLNADMTSTADQSFTKVFNGKQYSVTGVCARQRSGAATGNCLGGVFDGPGGTGNVIVPSTQSWLTLASGVMINAALATAQMLVNIPILTLNTVSFIACNADFFIYGNDLS